MMKRLILNGTLLLVPAASNATVYCIDPAGLATDGCDAIYTTASSITFLSGGDDVLFKRGETWNTKIIVPAIANSAPTNKVRYGAYGVGETPVIDVDRAQDTAFSCTNKSNLIVENITFKNSANNAMHFSNCHGIEISSVEVDFDLPDVDKAEMLTLIGQVGNNGIALVNGGSDITISNSVVSNAPNNGILIQGHATNHISNVVVEHNRISSSRTNDCITIHESGDHGPAGSQFLIRNNHSENCHEQGIDVTTGTGVVLRKNTTSQNGEGGVLVGGSANNVTIENHVSTNEPTKAMSAAISIGRPDVRLRNSVVAGNGYHLLTISPGADNVEVHNNTFVWDGGSSLFDLGGETGDIYVKNNIFTTARNDFRDDNGNSQRVVRFTDATSPPSYDSFHFDSNIYYSPTPSELRFQLKNASGTTSSFSFAQFQDEYAQEPHGRTANPLLIGRTTGDYHIESNSPAIHPETHVVVAFDHDMLPRTGAPDIGAYEAVEATNSSSEVPINGLVSGSHEDTHYNDEIYESVTENLSDSTVAHRWDFYVPPNAGAKFYVNAHYSGYRIGDGFTFAYRVPGGAFTNMLEVTKVSDDDEYQTYQLPSGISGTVVVRAFRAIAGSSPEPDTLFVDRMFIITD